MTWYTRHSFAGIDLSRDGHTVVTWEQLISWQQCREWSDFTAAPYKLAGAAQCGDECRLAVPNFRGWPK